VLLTVGIDCILLAALAYVIDFLQRTKWTFFFQVFGKKSFVHLPVIRIGSNPARFIPVGEKHQP